MERDQEAPPAKKYHRGASASPTQPGHQPPCPAMGSPASQPNTTRTSATLSSHGITSQPASPTQPGHQPPCPAMGSPASQPAQHNQDISHLVQPWDHQPASQPNTTRTSATLSSHGITNQPAQHNQDMFNQPPCPAMGSPASQPNTTRTCLTSHLVQPWDHQPASPTQPGHV